MNVQFFDMSLPKLGVVLVFSVIASLMSNQSLAQDDRGLARAQQMLRQLNAEKGQIEQELNQVRQEFQAYRTQKEREVSEAQLKQKELQASLAVMNDQGVVRQKENDHVNAQLTGQQAKNNHLETQLQIQTDNLSYCKQVNDQLASTAYELVDHYNNKGFTDLLKKKEPVTGLNKVAIENLMQTLTDKIEEQHLVNHPNQFKPIDDPAKSRVAQESFDE